MFSYSPNLWLVLVSAIIGLALGKLWFNLTGRAIAPISRRGLGLLAIAALASAYVLAHFVYYVGALTFTQGAITGFFIWLGFILPVLGAKAVIKNQRMRSFLLDASGPLVGLILMAGILVN